jgi:hypothetical protein
MPLLVPRVEQLVGTKVVNLYNQGDDDVNATGSAAVSVPGVAYLSGTFTLTFRGYTTAPIPSYAPAYGAGSLVEILQALPSIDTVEVSGGPSTDNVGSGAQFWAVTFTSDAQGGDLPALVPDARNLMGNGAAVRVCTNGVLCEGAPSQRGNELGGSFSLSLLGHTTAPVPFDAADTTLKAALEALPNVGTVRVTRTPPSPQRGYTWTVSFLSQPGRFPPGSGDLPTMLPAGADVLAPAIGLPPGVEAFVGLTGLYTQISVSGVSDGSTPLGGTFTLTYKGNETTPIAYDADPGTVQAALQALPSVGTVSVWREVTAASLR